ncbi:OmpL47-type beta-barrel domain-containing protein [Chryseolinea lacunae]|uniref:T9SS C-terminal target domain-containing protein n=1 Tax=Chryseolinea lacunae TaxID=2801331 RepID=A0ABS1KPH8_9BACT|nr:hypothetical protein [Chryseolinea lacunae]MBL0741233.1 hypothetical protein [Chryseolinea lacunae]
MRSILILMLCTTMVGLSAAQTNPEPKNYTAPDGTLYWNKKLPVYVILSPTTDPTKGVVLKEENVNHVRVYHFDTEGINWIRTRWATDSVTGKTLLPEREVMWPVMADGLPPVTGAKYLSSGKFVSGGQVYYSGDLKVQLLAQDAVSGVESTYFNTGSGFQAYQEPFPLSADGPVNIKFYSVDHVGNAEDKDAARNKSDFIIDRTAPESALTLIGPHVGNVVSRKTKIELKGTDGGSGVANVLYGFNKDASQLYLNLLDLTGQRPNENTLSYQAVDRVKNIEPQHTYDFFLDVEAPAVDYAVDVDFYTNPSGVNYVSDRSSFSLSATDNKAGVNKIYYAFDNLVAKNEYASSLKADQKPGFHKLYYSADDKVENVSKVEVLNYIVDVKTPRISYHAIGPKLMRNDTLFMRSISKINITSVDDGPGQSGVKKLSYEIDNTGSIAFTEDFSLAGDGLRKLSITSSDQVNNATAASQTIFLDNAAPEIIEVFGVDNIGTKVLKDQSYTIYPKEVQLYLAATDKNVGTQSIQYAINGGRLNAYTAPIKNLPAANYSILIKAVDMLGNMTTKTIVFAIE